MDKLKVAIIFPYYAHYRKPVIDSLKDDVEIEYHFFGGQKESPQFRGMKLIDMSVNDRFTKIENTWFLKYFSIQPGLSRKVKIANYNCVVIFGDWKYLSTWWVAIILRFRRVPTLFWSHGFRKNQNSFNDIFKTIYFKLFTGGLVFDQRAKDIFAEKGFKGDITVIYNSLDYKYQKSILEKVKEESTSIISDEVPYILFSGRLTRTKNLDQILKAIAYLDNQGVFVKVVFIGEGEFKHELIRLSEELGIDARVAFMGSCYDERIIANCFLNAKASVIPSAVGLSAIHALTYGCPVITDDNNVKHGPEVAAIRDGVTGKIFIQGDIKDLAKKIASFTLLSQEERDFYANNCIKEIESRYTAENQRNLINLSIKKVVAKF
ncbi:glycosyltransferase [Sphingobacterium sp. JB170]|uniref:glycosyltransferase n=1 Tax=Sphingobacterium sp. JB170 TaxID=1434842 RepID=UPI00097E91D4|nr:glycosyltransferase [Sphingobacterium sp. JB170]SJN28742.1 putative glycosyltransferase [Sphingobacterium sp. JB170]